MKIIRCGKKRKPFDRKHYWVGLHLTCSHCGCFFKLEKTDKPFFLKNNLFLDAAKYGVKCPQCKRIVETPHAVVICEARSFFSKYHFD